VVAAHGALAAAQRAEKSAIAAEEKPMKELWAGTPSIVPVGLMNVGNTCYLAAVLQALCPSGKSAVQYRGMHSIDHRLSPMQNTRVHGAACQLRQAVDLTRIHSHVSKLMRVHYNLLPNAERASFLVVHS
jgi:uncharacterized UBP type Zn finger protein